MKRNVNCCIAVVAEGDAIASRLLIFYNNNAVINPASSICFNQMANITLKRRDGFEGEKIINIPQKVSKDVFKKVPSVFQMYITQIGYFPKASSSHFSIVFRKATGMPPIDYFINLKMQKACQLLDMDESRIKEVAHNLGYEDQYYFSRLFKKYMGISPEQYRTSVKR